MILAIDVYYTEKGAKTVGIGFENWEDQSPSTTFVDHSSEIAEYESGEFYKRELPCILRLLDQIDLTRLDCIVIDGYVILNDMGKLGLGGHLYETLAHKIPVIGLAKTRFAQNEKNNREVFRGKSQKPLWITAAGMELDEVAQKIQDMHGEYRLPTLLKYLDSLTKS